MDKPHFFFLYFLAFFFLSACTNLDEAKQDKTSTQRNQLSSEHDATAASIGRTNFAVVWSWTTSDTALVAKYVQQMAEELMNLWKSDIVENTYYQAQPEVDRLGHFPSIAFFLKAQDEASAKIILDELTVVRQQIAQYKLFPVGQLWLERREDLASNNNELTNAYATVWTTSTSPLEGPKADQLLQQQSDKILALWKQGVVENVYFDIEGTYTANDKTDFVFFINAKSEEEAKEICDSLPFYEAEIASYQIYPAGVFWMGKYAAQ